MAVDSAERRLNTAVLALVYLGNCKGGGYVAHREIAQKHNLPTRDVVRLMRSLAEAGFVTTRFGKQGGVSITKPLSQISIRELYEACGREDGAWDHATIGP